MDLLPGAMRVQKLRYTAYKIGLLTYTAIKNYLNKYFIAK